MDTAARDLEQQQRDRHADRPVAQCRICAADITDDDGMHIFAEDGRRHYLQTKIRKYLHILVSKKPRARFRAYLRIAGAFFPPPLFFISLSLFFLSKFAPLSYATDVAITCWSNFRSSPEFQNKIDFRSFDRDRFLEIGRDRAAILSARRSFRLCRDRDEFLRSKNARSRTAFGEKSAKGNRDHP